MPRPARLIEVASAPLDELSLPVQAMRLDLGGDRRGFVLTMSARARTGMSTEAFHSLAKNIGDLVYPASAFLVVLPDGELLTAYKLEVE